MLQESRHYNPRELVVEVDSFITKEFCHDCSNCPFSLGEKEADIFINGKKRYVWCYAILLNYIVEALDNQQ